MAKKRGFFLTKIKRSHLVLRNGVGALVRTRQGTTALVAGLPLWIESLSAIKKEDTEKYLKMVSFREPELTLATGIGRFIPPPKEEDQVRSWEIPLLRFPLTGYCTNFNCNQVTIGTSGDPNGRAWRCKKCAPDRKNNVLKQVPIFYACPAGHLSEIDFTAAIEHAPGCPENRTKLTFKARVELVTARCLDCGNTGTPKNIPCNGRTPWLQQSPEISCPLEMSVVSRTSIKAYFPTTRSAIHIPSDADFRQDVLDWMSRAGWHDVLDPDDDAGITRAAKSLAEDGWQLTPDQAKLHVQHFLRDKNQKEEDWDILEARTREFDAFAGRRRDAILEASELLQLEDMTIADYRNGLVQSGVITHITTVHKLTESRVLNGFSRIEPRLVGPREGRLQMWGRDTGAYDFLPGYRAHGEGIFFVFAPERFALQGSTEASDARTLFALSEAGSAVHTFAHLMILLIADESGYSVPSLRDRLYDLKGGRLGVLIYTAEGDSMGTLGGLAALARPENLDTLIERLITSEARCPQDPVCEEQVLDLRSHIAAACHQCALLPETSCELFNSYLDRQVVRRTILLDK
jgi:hypothetical protein